MNKLRKHKILFAIASFLADCVIAFKRKGLDRLAWFICSLLPVQKNKILFSNFDGRGYADNQKYIAEEILRRELPYRLVWILQNPKAQKASLPAQIHFVKVGTFAYIYQMATSKFWINNVRIASYFQKKKDQIYIQTWHAGLGFKKIEKDVENTLSKEYIALAKKDSAAIDLIVSNGSFMTGHFKRIFWYDGEFLEKGHPRNDLLCRNSLKEKESVRKKLGISGKTKLALYAPTFRANYGLEVYDLDYDRVLSALTARFGGEWKFLLRLHPNLFDKFDAWNLDSDTVLNVSSYSDMQELLLVSDVMVTDFSSAMFEFAIMDKPCFLYASDLYDYLDERGLLITLEEVPFPQAASNSQLCRLISEFDTKPYLKRVHEFMEHKVCDCGKASEAVTEWILAHSDRE